ncbi:MAG: shikimate kinase [Eubacteriales bacterium]|nr:shikimate kinase [Eubacteriales bacterium]
MDKFGLIGAKLGHSYSPMIHEKLGSYEYDLLETKPEDLESLLRGGEYKGFNVTIPYKKVVFRMCDDVSEEAGKLGSVNTVVRDAEGKLHGYNTDYFGFKYLLEHNDIDVEGKKCIVLGSGGASVTICQVLRDMEASEVVTISRKGENNYENIEKNYDAQVIVNTTPVGMYPNNGDSLVDPAKFPGLEAAVDIIYNPYRTKFILDAMELEGVKCASGLEMLVGQAQKSSELFTGVEKSEDEIEDIADEVKRQMLNNILIGMPGAGKTFLGKKMAEKSGRKFVDIDDMIVAHEGESIPEIFAEKGEPYFRKVEREMLKLACKESGQVIATGGGIVKNKANYNIVKQNGVVIWIKRDLDKLETDGRPVSSSTPLDQLYAERKDAYEKWSDYFIDNNENLK